jgi:hypothetical protein
MHIATSISSLACSTQQAEKHNAANINYITLIN